MSLASQAMHYSGSSASAVVHDFQFGAGSAWDNNPVASDSAPESTDGEGERQSGAYPAFTPQPASESVPPSKAERRQSLRTARLRPSLLRAIHMGHQLYLNLSPQEREVIHGRGRKLQSFRKLAESSNVATSTLWRALSTYTLYLKHPEIAEYVHLGVGHVSVVLSVEEEYRLYFLRNAEIAKWSRRKLDEEVKFYHAYRAQRDQIFVSGRQTA